jgi:hypothetical protein
MNKHAVSMTFIMVAIILLLLTLALLFFINTVFQKTKAFVPEEKCRLSVEREATLNQVLKHQGAGHTAADFASNLECQQIHINVTGKDEKQLVALTAGLMERCWKTFGSGRLELFSRGEGTFCHVCYAVAYEAGTSFDLASALQKRKDFVQGKYDLLPKIEGETHGIIFRYQLGAQGIEQKIAVRPLDPAQPQALELCKGAYFPPQRLT